MTDCGLNMLTCATRETDGATMAHHTTIANQFVTMGTTPLLLYCAETGGDGDWSVQARWPQENGLQGGHHDRPVPQVRGRGWVEGV